MSEKKVGYPGTLYVIAEESIPPRYQGRLNMEHLPISAQMVRIAEYKLVRQIEVRREVVVNTEVG